ncbi:ubiquinone biosynthesis monooxygenase Coq6 [Talaromyces islandicus]|uniref:Ubiquinone biosynthesis monooxygenase COQ6, mitochondrial n=1 Tax=Talaromyces islandicus TaxID=28573 RepID=A0A0U1M9M1_TALIS|nr:ubiquinone biosynthesis monooxygenase Coq6 [Talaromyces islandicus]
MRQLNSLLRPYICPSCRRGSQYRGRRTLSSLAETPDIYDVVCVGGGTAGLALAAALRASPVTSKLRVALIESQDLSKSRSWSLKPDEYSNRCSSLTPTSVAFLQKIGAWKHVDSSRVQQYHEMKVWDGQTGSKISFDWSVDTSPFEDVRSVATMTENANLVRGLLSRIGEVDGDGRLSIFANTTVSSIENGSKIAAGEEGEGPDLSAWPVLSLSSSVSPAPQKPIAARLLVGADGINSPVRSFADITTNGWDYGRHGVVATLSLAGPAASSLLPDSRTAYQRFLPSLGGPIAILPLPNNRASLVWSTKVENAAYLKSLPQEAFIAMVNAAFRLSMTDLGYMLGLDPAAKADKPTASGDLLSQHEDELNWRLQHTHPTSDLPPFVTAVQDKTVASFPLRFRHASSYISPRVALVGDAAHVIHPLAGQGLNLGIGDVASLADTIEYAVTHGMDIGDYLSLEKYMADRYLTNAKIGGMCDVLHKLYNVPGNGPVTWARSLGLDVIDKLPWVKGFIMKQAE